MIPTRIPVLLECVQTSGTGSPAALICILITPAPPKPLSSRFTLFPSILPLFSLTSSNSFHNNQTKYPSRSNQSTKQNVWVPSVRVCPTTNACSLNWAVKVPSITLVLILCSISTLLQCLIQSLTIPCNFHNSADETHRNNRPPSHQAHLLSILEELSPSQNENLERMLSSNSHPRNDRTDFAEEFKGCVSNRVMF